MNEENILAGVAHLRELADKLRNEIQRLQKERSQSYNPLLHTDRICELIQEFVEIDYTYRRAISEIRADLRKNKDPLYLEIPEEFEEEEEEVDVQPEL